MGGVAKLKLVVRGIRRLKGKDLNGKHRLPITLSILRDLQRGAHPLSRHCSGLYVVRLSLGFF